MPKDNRLIKFIRDVFEERNYLSKTEIKSLLAEYDKVVAELESLKRERNQLQMDLDLERSHPHADVD